MARKITVEDKVEIRKLVSKGTSDEEILQMFKRHRLTKEELEKIKSFKKTY